jgi:hypothetical protein
LTGVNLTTRHAVIVTKSNPTVTLTAVILTAYGVNLTGGILPTTATLRIRRDAPPALAYAASEGAIIVARL